MKMYDALQSNLGQYAAGIPIPATEAELSIPFVDYNFDNKPMLIAGAIVGTVALGGLKLHRDNSRRIANEEYPQGSHMKEIAQPRALRQQAYDFLLVSALSTAAVGGLAHLADPYTEESRSEIDSISIIIDASAQGLTADVEGDDGEKVARIKAAVDEINAFDGLAEEGITATYIAAGTTAEAVATVMPGDDRNIVVDGYEAYINNDVNLGTGSNAKPDIEGAIRAAKAANSDAVFIVAGTLERVDGSLLLGESEPEEHKTVIVALGTPGSTVLDKAGNEIDAVLNKSFNDTALGKEDSYITDSQADLSDIISNVIKEQYVITEKKEVDEIGKFALYAGIVAGVGFFMRFMNETYGTRVRNRFSDRKN